MILYILFACSILLVPVVFSDNKTTPEIIANKTLNATQTESSKTKLYVSEGGALSPNEPDLTLSKETSLLALEDESGKAKKTTSKGRKGVDKDIPDNNTVKKDSTTVSDSDINVSSDKKKSNISIPTKNITNVSTQKLSTESVKPQIVPEVHKKPLILSYEALSSADKNVQNDQMPLNPSSKTMTNDQIPSPNNGDSVVKVYPAKANSHPGMIMPIVITILVVPMFAIVGYMALRKGQEAWKNRHYKRMDFLLDGMYND